MGKGKGAGRREAAVSEALGVDIGGVIIDRANDGSDTSFFSGRYLETTPVTGALEALRRLVDERFGESVHLVSKCGKRTEARTREWLTHHHFHECTGIPIARVHFCRERADKAPICRDLGITHFIDDRREVLAYLEGIVPYRLLFTGGPAPREDTAPARQFQGIIEVPNWDAVIERLLRQRRI